MKSEASTLMLMYGRKAMQLTQDGSIDSQALPDYSKLVPLLTAALQEALTYRLSDGSRITALEG
jgi:hypothetical protein